MTVQTSPPPPLISALTAEQISELAAIQALLALAWHRNKNQHRRSRWWAEFGMLKRGVEKLIRTEGVDCKGGGKDDVGLRMKFLREEVLERCWLLLTKSLPGRAFSAVVADNQYAALGLMLLGTLARLGKVLGLKIDSHSQAVMEGEEVVRLDLDTLEVFSRIRVGKSLSGNVDLGVVLRREELGSEVENTEDVVIHTRTGNKKRPRVLERDADSLMPDSEASVLTSASIVKPQKKRKKKKGDEFDELFSSLI